MFIVVMRDVGFSGPVPSFFWAKSAKTPEEALEAAKSNMDDGCLLRLHQGAMEVEAIECGNRYEYFGGKFRQRVQE